MVGYDISISEGTQQFHRDLQPSAIWGYNVVGQPPISPGPTFMATYGQGALVRFHNDLPRDHCGFGDPHVSTHLHNGHTPSESDGFPDDFYPHGLFKDHHYPNIYAGYDTFPRDPITQLPGDW